MDRKKRVRKTTPNKKDELTDGIKRKVDIAETFKLGLIQAQQKIVDAAQSKIDEVKAEINKLNKRICPKFHK